MKDFTLSISRPDHYVRPILQGGLKWQEALRSGDYKPTGNTLKRKYNNGEVSYCCLGVACEIQGIFKGDSCKADYGMSTSESVMPGLHPWAQSNGGTMQFPGGAEVKMLGNTHSEITSLNDAMVLEGFPNLFKTMAILIGILWDLR